MANLSNPSSTGSLGPIFETRVQTAFVSLMLSKGVCPALPTWPIYEVKLQGRYAGYDTDDVIVAVEDSATGRKARMIAQIKHAPKITKGDSQFSEVIDSAWKDYNNPKLFFPQYDVLALITGPLSAADTEHVRAGILEFARTSADADEFYQKVYLAKFSHKKKQEKLEAFEHHLTNANKGVEPSKHEIWSFLKSFTLLGYDLDINAGATISLLQSMLGVASNGDVEKVWLKILNEVQSSNPRAGTLTLDSLPQELLDYFDLQVAPKFTRTPPTPLSEEALSAAILGAWDEKMDGDREIIEEFTGMEFSKWQGKIRSLWNNQEQGGNHD